MFVLKVERLATPCTHVETLESKRRINDWRTCGIFAGTPNVLIHQRLLIDDTVNEARRNERTILTNDA